MQTLAARLAILTVILVWALARPVQAATFFSVPWDRYVGPVVHETYDEPDFHNISGAQVRATYRQLEPLYPGRLAITLYTGLTPCYVIVGPYLGGFDQLLIDDYPFDNVTTNLDGLDEWKATVDGCLRFTRFHHLRPPVFVAQAFGGIKEDPSDPYSAVWRCPPYAFAQAMVRYAQVRGAAGVVWWNKSGHPCAIPRAW